MKASKEYRQVVNRIRRRRGKKNGVIAFLDEYTCHPRKDGSGKKKLDRSKVVT